MAVTAFQDLPLADSDRSWDGAAAEKRVRAWAGAQDEPNPRYRDAHVWYDAEKKSNFTAYKLLIADVLDGKRPTLGVGAVMPAGTAAVRSSTVSPITRLDPSRASPVLGIPRHRRRRGPSAVRAHKRI
jgi:hypothetical protein